MEARVGQLEAEGRVLEGARLRQRTTFDLEMMRELGYCTGVENYSRHLSRREAGSRPWTLLDYFPPDWLLVVDESHMTIPQVVGHVQERPDSQGDPGRLRVPAAVRAGQPAADVRGVRGDRPPGDLHERDARAIRAGAQERVVQQLIRPTGIVDPHIEVRPTEGQIDDLLEEIAGRVERGERALVTTLTKKMAEDLTDYLRELGVKVQYLHSEVDTLERVAILRDLRLGVFDVLVGINLLREGIDLPEVTLVAILDADKEGFLRSAWSLIQMIGRAARNTGGGSSCTPTGSPSRCRSPSTRRTGGARSRTRITWSAGSSRPRSSRNIHDLNERLRVVASRPRCTPRSAPASSATPTAPRWRRWSAGWRPRCGRRPRRSNSSARRRCATRSSRSACGCSSRTPRSRSLGQPNARAGTVTGAGRSGLTSAADRARGRRAADAAIAAGPVMEVTNVTVLAADEEPVVHRTTTAGTGRGPHPTGCRGSVTSTRTRVAARPGGWSDPPGIAR